MGYSVVNSSINGNKKTIIIKDNKVIINGKKYVVPDTWAVNKTNVVNGHVYIDGHDVEKELVNDGEMAISNFDAYYEAKQHPHHNYNDVPFYTDRNFRTITGLESQIKKAEKEEEERREAARKLAEAEEQKKKEEKEAVCKRVEESIREVLYPYYGTITDLDAFLKEIFGLKLIDIVDILSVRSRYGQDPADYTSVYQFLRDLEIKRREHDDMPFDKFKDPETTEEDVDDITEEDDGRELVKPKKKSGGFFDFLSKLFK